LLDYHREFWLLRSSMRRPSREPRVAPLVERLPIRRFVLSISIVLASSILTCDLPAWSASSDETSGHDPFHGDKAMQETWKQSQILRQELSTDTTPEPFIVGSITYLVPRNYIYNNFLRILKVTYPDFKPFTEDSADCFDARIAIHTGCRTIEITIENDYSAKEFFEAKLRNTNKSDVARHDGAFGYSIYEFGPDNARIEYYVQSDRNIYFHCLIQLDSGRRDGICNDRFSLLDGNSAMFFFRLNQIESVSDIEAQESLHFLKRKKST
jgi:hypothetical protein